MNRYVIFGIATIAIGSTVMAGAAQHLAWMIFGGAINGFGLFVMTAGTINSSKKDKAEIIGRILGFREEIVALKKIVPEGESLEAVERVETEFSDWAETFSSNMDLKIVERQKDEILLREHEIYLSHEWKYLYKYFFETLSKMLSAYNLRTDSKIEITIPAVPSNLFGEDAQSFKSIIAFDHGTALAILLQIERPYKNVEIPNIIVYFYTSNTPEESAKELAQAGMRGSGVFLLLITQPKEECIRAATSGSNLYIPGLRNHYSIKPSDYEATIRELIATLIEYQLIKIVNN